MRVAALLGAAALAGCLSSGERERINDWLLCDDCTTATRDSVADIGLEAIPRLAGALYGPPPHRDSIMRFKLTQMYGSLTTPRVSQQDFVEFHAANYRAQYQEHAALALGEIGRRQDFLCKIWGCARDELLRAFRRDSVLRVQGGGFYPTDVLEVIRDEIEMVGDSTELPIGGLRLGFLVDSLAVDSTRVLTARVLDIAGRLVTGATYVWASSNTGIATASSTGLIRAVDQGLAVIYVQATIGPLTLADSSVVVVP